MNITNIYLERIYLLALLNHSFTELKRQVSSLRSPLICILHDIKYSVIQYISDTFTEVLYNYASK